jgi:hypothetical protein
MHMSEISAASCVTQVLRVYNMRGDFGHASPGLLRLPVSGPPLAAGFWGSTSSAGAIIEGLGEAASLALASASSDARGVQQREVLPRLHSDARAAAAAVAPTSGGGEPVAASMTRTKGVAVVVGSRKVADVEPNGIENYQVLPPFTVVVLLDP